MKSIEVELFRKKIKLYERSALDVFQFFEFAKEHPIEKENSIWILECAMMIRDALKPNLKWYNKILLSRKVNINYLLKNLSPAQLLKLSEKINELEGNKKKVISEENP